MKVTYNWLRDYVEIKIPAQALADKLTMAGLEVVSLTKFADDWVLEIEVTTNRPDWLSVIGIAREVSAITGKRLREPQISPRSKVQGPKSKVQGPKSKGQSAKPLEIRIEDKIGCLRYVGRIIDNVEIRPSPDWLKKRLEAVGLRSINNIVDITNFCLLELGQPMHAFDYDRIEGCGIFVRRARNKEKIITLDGEEKILDGSILVIADKAGPIALAGIMGGKKTEVRGNSGTILLESAYFDPVLTRTASKSLSLLTESSYRFERRVNLETVLAASLRAADLIEKLAAPKNGKVVKGNIVDVGLKRRKEKKVELEVSSVTRLLGQTVSSSEIRKILSSLHFGVKKTGEGVFEIEIPSFRLDVESVVDLIEEIARMHGYEKIPLTLASSREPGGVVLEPAESSLKRVVRGLLLSLGFYEIINYSLISAALLEKINFSQNETLLKLANPLSSEQALLRPTLSAGILGVISSNARRRNQDLKLFELGNIYSREERVLEERPFLAVGLTGRRYFDWQRKDEVVNFYDLKGALEALMQKLGISDLVFSRKELPYFNSACSAQLKLKNEPIGFAGEVSGRILNNFELRQKIYLAELDLNKLLSSIGQKRKYRALPKYPPITRDVSLIVEADISYGRLKGFFTREASDLIKEINLIDVYTGKGIPAGKKSLTFSLKFQSQERTLREEEIEKIEAKLRHGLVKEFAAELR